MRAQASCAGREPGPSQWDAAMGGLNTRLAANAVASKAAGASDELVTILAQHVEQFTTRRAATDRCRSGWFG